MKNSQLMDYMVSLHFIDFISWCILDTGPLYCITLWIWRAISKQPIETVAFSFGVSENTVFSDAFDSVLFDR
jgi:hypothetical protein